MKFRVPDRLLTSMIALCAMAAIAGFQALGMGRDDRGAIAMRCFMVAGVLAALSIAAVVNNTRYARQRHGKTLCHACGYDLCATPDRCPECGTVAKGNRTAGKPPGAA